MKMPGFVEQESGRLGVDDEPEGQESSAVTPGSVEQQTDQRVDVPPSGLGFGRRIREMRGAAGSVPVIGS